MGKLNSRTPYIAWKIIERIDLILDIHSKECTWQAV